MRQKLTRLFAMLLVAVMVVTIAPVDTARAAEEVGTSQVTGENAGSENGENNPEDETGTGSADQESSTIGEKAGDSKETKEDETSSADKKIQAVEGDETQKTTETEQQKTVKAAKTTKESDKQEIEPALNYLYIDKAESDLYELQTMVVSWGDGNEGITKMELILENETGEKMTLRSSGHADGAFLFQDMFEEGVWQITGLKVYTSDSEKEFTKDELEISAHFSVGTENPDGDKSTYMEMESLVDDGSAGKVEASTVSLDSEGNVTQENSIADALDSARSAIPSTMAATKSSGDLVIVLDPGHDKSHAGARGNGVKEEEVTLKIAQYCKAELEQYVGVKVYLSRSSASCPYPSTVGKSSGNILDIKERVKKANSLGADVFISFHLNASESSSPKGAEVYYHSKNTAGKNLAQKIQNELTALGIYDREIKSWDGLAVVNTSQKYGFPGVLIEHAFVSNKTDASKYLKTEESIKKLGIADATGIAKYYGLSKGVSVSGRTTSSISLKWPKISGASGYDVYRKSGSGSYKLIGSTTSTAYTDKGLAEGTVYYYKVQSYTGSGSSKVPGKFVSTVTGVTGISGTKLSGQGTAYNTLKLTWKKVTGASGYQLQRYVPSTKSYSATRTVNSGSTTSCTSTDKAASTTYKWRIRAFKRTSAGTVYSAWSSPINVKTKGAVYGRVKVSKLYVRSGAGTSYKKLKTVKKNTKIKITGTKGSWYRVSVKVGRKTKTGYVQQKRILRYPGKTTTVKATAKSFDKIKLTWKKVSGASGYQIQRYSSSKKKYVTVKTITKGSTTSYTNGSLNSSTTYKYRIRAYKKSGSVKTYGSYSTVQKAKTDGARIGRVKSKKVNIRKSYKVSSKRYKTVKKNTKLQIKGSRGSWYRVKITVKGKNKIGYIKKSHVKLI